jgi:protein tyrosine phosphatase (PTP) superfamily phosphohydrolase (DUF442 family)
MSDCQTTPKRRVALPRLLTRGCLLGIGLALLYETVNILIGSNFHIVTKGSIFRCAQLSGDSLERIVKAHGIRTVINLRGCCEPLPWYLEQCRTLSRLNVSQEDLGCSAGRLPSVYTVRELVRILDQTDYPILVHCHRGIDRTGLVVAVAQLLHTDISLDDARSNLSLRFGHLSLGKTGNMDRFFDLYQEWLEATGQQHSQTAFRQWIEKEYCPGECRAHLEVLEPKGSVLRVPRDTPLAVRIRSTNTSVKPWRFRPGATAGIHVVFMVHNDNGGCLVIDRAGLLHATVAPGESIDLTVPVPPLKEPGRYVLRMDMVDEQHANFFQVGSEPLMMELEVE